MKQICTFPNAPHLNPNTPHPAVIVVKTSLYVMGGIFQILGKILYAIAIWTPLAYVIGPLEAANGRAALDQARLELTYVRAAKVQVDLDNALLRRQMLAEQIRTQAERTAKTANDAVLTDLKIEEKRKELYPQRFDAENYQ